MKTILPFLFLLSFACYGQVYTINEKGDTINTAYGTFDFRNYIRQGWSCTVIGSSATGKPVGEYHYTAKTDTPQTDSNPHDFYSDTLAINTEQFQTATLKPELSLEEKLLLYAQECWNDSTLGEKQYHKTSVDTTTCERWVGLGNVKYYGACEKQSHYYKKYIHRKPTFEGFVEWLKKK